MLLAVVTAGSQCSNNVQVTTFTDAYLGHLWYCGHCLDAAYTASLQRAASPRFIQ